MKSVTRTKLVQKIYEKTKNPDGVIDFGKDPYIRHIKKVFKGYFEEEEQLNEILSRSLSAQKYLRDILKKKNNLMKF